MYVILEKFSLLFCELTKTWASIWSSVTSCTRTAFNKVAPFIDRIVWACLTKCIIETTIHVRATVYRVQLELVAEQIIIIIVLLCNAKATGLLDTLNIESLLCSSIRNDIWAVTLNGESSIVGSVVIFLRIIIHSYMSCSNLEGYFVPVVIYKCRWWCHHCTLICHHIVDYMYR